MKAGKPLPILLVIRLLDADGFFDRDDPTISLEFDSQFSTGVAMPFKVDIGDGTYVYHRQVSVKKRGTVIELEYRRQA